MPFPTPVTTPESLTVATLGESLRQPDVIGWDAPVERVALPLALVVRPTGRVGACRATAIDAAVVLGAVGVGTLPPPPPQPATSDETSSTQKSRVIPLILELNLPTLYERTRITSASLLAACLVQALIPPVLIYRHRAVALNCYASFVVQRIERAQTADAWPLSRGIEPFTLRVETERKAVSDPYGCAPIHVVRP